MKQTHNLEIDRVMPDGTIQYCWRIQDNLTAQEIIDIVMEEHKISDHKANVGFLGDCR